MSICGSADAPSDARSQQRLFFQLLGIADPPGFAELRE